MPTLQDIVKELVKPGRDPRDELPAPILRTDVLELKDLKPGMVLTGTVRNVIDFGVFVDIGVHQDGLVHISQVSSKFIKHPSEVVSVGDVVKVAVLDVDQKRRPHQPDHERRLKRRIESRPVPGMEKRICILYTGGTIGMVPSEKGYVPSSGAFLDLLRAIPDLYWADMPRWDVVEFDPLLDSSDITVREWNQIGRAIAARYDDYDGFVVLHGARIRWHTLRRQFRLCWKTCQSP